MVAAITDAGVSQLVLTASVTFTDAAFAQVVPAPYPLTRNLTITGADVDPAAWPVFDVNFVKNKIVIGRGVALRLTRLVILRMRQVLYLQAPGLDFIASSPDPIPSTTANPAEWGHLFLENASLVTRICLRPADGADYQTTLPRPAFLPPGPQRWTPNASQAGCTPLPAQQAGSSGSSSSGGSSTATPPPAWPWYMPYGIPYMKRCYPQVTYFSDGALFAYNVPEGSIRPVQAGYVVYLVDAQFKCEALLDSECEKRLGVYACFQLMFAKTNTTSALTPVSSGGSAVAPGNGSATSASASNSSSRSGSSTLLPSNQQPLGTATGSGGGTSGSSTSAHLGAIIGGVVGGVVLVATIAAAVVGLLRHRSRRLRRDSSGAVSSTSSDGLSAAGKPQPARDPCGPAADAGAGPKQLTGCGPTAAAAAVGHKPQQDAPASSGSPCWRDAVAVTIASDKVAGASAVMYSTSSTAAMGPSLRTSAQFTDTPEAPSALPTPQPFQSHPQRYVVTAGASEMPVVPKAPMRQDLNVHVEVRDALQPSAAAVRVAAASSPPAARPVDPATVCESAVAASATAAHESAVAASATAAHAALAVAGGVPAAGGQAAGGTAAAASELPQPCWEADASSQSSQRMAVEGNESLAVVDSRGAAGASTEAAAVAGGARPAAAALATPPVPTPVVELLPRVLGKGAFGRVVEGRYQGRPVAVKLLLRTQLSGRDPQAASGAAGGGYGTSAAQSATAGDEGAALNEEYIKAFVQEVQILGRVDHPCVVKLLAACVVPPRLALVMEMMEGSLEKLVFERSASMAPGAPPRQQLMPLPKLLHIAIQICQGLAYLHPTVIHRDLPANVLLSGAHTDWPVVKLADFGLARMRLQTMRTDNPEVGTPAYMAPELFELDTEVVTHHADMYSLAVVIWVMLTGREPWQDCQNVVAMAYKVCLGERPPLDAIPPERCPPKLRRLIIACWDRDPRRRPAAAETLKELVLIHKLITATAQLSEANKFQRSVTLGDMGGC
ncbi:hypothetical protein HXX76_012486 [Chlamydomonas incerta]|uniref:Protein kinase domain-containing protein n=1 Tax=Chlamydomonas incerta TaxID=51695 RepID=A0A835SV10_CHLIN|nr:hypothetical protein HXX76_012486 [Chlamydomonas incerta]|eukprot:KAG2427290.1 hypothetical protein HXX76_012486 [Chlamydomonas incerta]